MGRRVIDAADGPGFLVNRCGRPFGLEALRCVTEGIAEPHVVDRIARLGGALSHGAVRAPGPRRDRHRASRSRRASTSSASASRAGGPSPLSARMVASGRHGRKTGRGWYAYDDAGAIVREPDPPAPRPGGVPDGGMVVIAGDLQIADDLRALAIEAGWDVRDPGDAGGEVPRADRRLRRRAGRRPAAGRPGRRCSAPRARSPRSTAAAAPPASTRFRRWRRGGLVELTRTTRHERARRRARRALLRDARPAQRVGRRCARAWCSGGSSASSSTRRRSRSARASARADDVDAGMVLGLNHPRGPLAWGDEIGLDHVLAVLDALHAERGDPAYRAAPLLRELVLTGRLGVQTGPRLPRAPGRLAAPRPHAAGASARSTPVTPPPFQRFLDEQREPVWRFLVASVGREHADDCFQETFLAALRAYPRAARRGQPARLGADDRPPQGARPSPRPRPARRCPVAEVPEPRGRETRSPVDGARRRARLGARARAAAAPARRPDAALRRRPDPRPGRRGARLLRGGLTPGAA